MYVTCLIVDAPDQLAATRLVRDDAAAVTMLRRMYPELTQGTEDHDVVHRLSCDGIQVRISRHDLAPLRLDEDIPPSPYGDLHRFSTYLNDADGRQGHYLRPATAMEAAMSLSCARFDGGVGVFGVRARVLGPSAITAAGAEETEFLHYGSRAWRNALVGGLARYYRVENIAPEAVLPDVSATMGPQMPVPEEGTPDQND